MTVAAMVDRLVHHAEVIVNANMGCQAMVVGMRHFSRRCLDSRTDERPG